MGVTTFKVYEYDGCKNHAAHFFLICIFLTTRDVYTFLVFNGHLDVLLHEQHFNILIFFLLGYLF